MFPLYSQNVNIFFLYFPIPLFLVQPFIARPSPHDPMLIAHATAKYNGQSTWKQQWTYFISSFPLKYFLHLASRTHHSTNFHLTSQFLPSLPCTWFFFNSWLFNVKSFSPWISLYTCGCSVFILCHGFKYHVSAPKFLSSLDSKLIYATISWTIHTDI